MAVQQRKKSKAKTRQRKSANHLESVQATFCPNCEAPRLPHRVCRNCGFYNGKQVLSVTAD